MLPRAAFRALRIRPVLTAPRTTPTALTSQCTRAYAKKAKKTGQDKTWKPTDPIKFDAENKARPIPVSPSTQPEFDTAASPDANTTPTQPSRPQSSATETSNEPGRDFAPEQEEFSGPKTPGENTAPTTESAEESTETPQQPQKPLPDLRYGIPSTFADEVAAAEGKARRDPDDPSQEPAAGSTGGREGGELPKSAYETSTDRRRNRVANWSYLATLLFGTVGAVYMGRPWETEAEEDAHPDAPNGWGVGDIYARAAARVNGQKAYYTEPTFQKLLPDKDKIPGGAPELTLVLSLEDLLLHSEWSTQHGYRLAKRPGLDYFLRYLSSQYELVIFTSVKSMDADPIIRKLDPFRLVMWPLFREATRFENGEYVKDLSYLNRDLSKVIVLDTNPAHTKMQPENAIILPKWKGTPTDTDLVALIPFLEYCAMMSQSGQPLDIRTILASMAGKHIPTEYARREAKLREQFLADRAAQTAKARPSAGGMFMKSLGLDAAKPGMVLGDQNIAQGMAEGKMMIDMYREFNRQNYRHLDQQIRENGETWLREMAEEEKKMVEAQMKDMKAGAFGASYPPPHPHPPSPPVPPSRPHPHAPPAPAAQPPSSKK
ncbi:hypothetical protein P153DRAFT_426420 [Dothidotthia symphoricarpi CBS 119687]|uniref:Mitochondrial import inner membrane translocase subunit TIM50 n=1 Tax=Dothidotthia symphoricarpi CBS 119687 TaxID=1392245 RepID=A0A6A6A1C8_9PLEO|nr:uncharacterized protein P153DRAFT_426420 [Dothidotthia symphoricarpi CBS 119687]KAF2124361.1 hypothetical protein P153DRAFT_426420 [Dothidotthia symphoricarpi CBS 119687]